MIEKNGGDTAENDVQEPQETGTLTKEQYIQELREKRLADVSVAELVDYIVAQIGSKLSGDIAFLSIGTLALFGTIVGGCSVSARFERDEQQRLRAIMADEMEDALNDFERNVDFCQQ